MPSQSARTFHSSRAFLVRSVDMGEADRRITFFTETAGLVTLLGKSARRSRKRFGGTLQKYFLLDIAWTDIPNRLPLMGQTSLVASFWDLLEEWERVRYADHILEIAATMFPQPGPKPKAFEALYAGMRALALGESPSSVGRKTEAAFLSIGGWGPNLSGCRRCGKRDAGFYRFVPSEGGIKCAACSAVGQASLSLGAVKTWRAFQSSSPSLLRRVRVPEGILKELLVVIPGYVEYCMGKPLRSLNSGDREENG